MKQGETISEPVGRPHINSQEEKFEMEWTRHKSPKLFSLQGSISSKVQHLTTGDEAGGGTNRLTMSMRGSFHESDDDTEPRHVDGTGHLLTCAETLRPHLFKKLMMMMR